MASVISDAEAVEIEQPAPLNGAAPEASKMPERRVNPLKVRKLQDRRSALEAEVSKCEAEIAEIETGLGNFVSVEETVRLNDLLSARRAALEALLAEWEEVEKSIEAGA